MDDDPATGMGDSVRTGDDELSERVRTVVNAIPAGRVASYGDIGGRLGVGARRIGRMMSTLEEGVAWWRVVYADGTPATCHGGTAPAILRAEGTPMVGHRIDMSRARYALE